LYFQNSEYSIILVSFNLNLIFSGFIIFKLFQIQTQYKDTELSRLKRYATTRDKSKFEFWKIIKIWFFYIWHHF
jgi:hypothetical protein